VFILTRPAIQRPLRTGDPPADGSTGHPSGQVLATIKFWSGGSTSAGLAVAMTKEPSQLFSCARARVIIRICAGGTALRALWKWVTAPRSLASSTSGLAILGRVLGTRSRYVRCSRASRGEAHRERWKLTQLRDFGGCPVVTRPAGVVAGCARRWGCIGYPAPHDGGSQCIRAGAKGRGDAGQARERPGQPELGRHSTAAWRGEGRVCSAVGSVLY
jgi:hypothetical protein